MKKNKFQSDFEDSNQDPQENVGSEPVKRLTREERKMIRATKRKGIDRSTLDPYDKSDMAEAKRYAKKNKFKVIFVATTLILLLALIAAIVTVLIIKSQNGPSKADYEVTVGKDKPYKLSYRESNEYGQFYFDLCSIAGYTDLVVTGGIKEGLKFSCPDGTYVRLVHDSATATVNGDAVKVGGKVKIFAKTNKEAMKCLVPFKFVEKLFSTKINGQSRIVVKVSDKNKVTIHRKYYDEGEKNVVPLTFSSDCFEYAKVQLASYPSPDIDKKTADAICTAKLLLVNKSHKLNEDEVTSAEMISLKSLNLSMFSELDTDNNKDFFDPIAALALVAMVNEANKNLEGDDKILVSSAFRTYEYQEGLLEAYVDDYMSLYDVSEEEAREQVLLTSAPAGASEHHTGLCVDLVEKRGVAYELDESFENTEAFAWLSKNAHKYGFILRYPKDKTEITKYSYEPWHYRFVGVHAATVIYEDGITLEEYLVKVD